MRRIALFGLGLALVGCAVVAPTAASPSASSAAPTADPSIAVLERPLAFPTFVAGCPQSVAHSVLPGVGDGLGPGPVWPIGLEPPGATLGASSDGIWHAVKVLWAAAPSYLGAILVRGSRIDAPGAMRFSLDGGATRTDQLYLPAGGPDPRQLGWPSYTLVEASGCYAYQIEGSGFSYTVVFAIGS